MSKVEVDEVLSLVSHVGAEVASYNAVPCWVVFLIEFFLNEGSDVFLNVVFFKSLGADIDSILLHIFGHVCVFNNCFAVCHLILSNGI